MRVVLTGATGYIGTVVAEVLRKAGHTVVGVARSDESMEKLRARGDEAVRGDISRPQEFANAVRDADAVIHTAATDGEDRGDADMATVEMVLGLYDSSGKRFIYTAGVWDNGSRGDEIIDEETPPDPPAYLAWRPPVEERVLAAGLRGVQTVVIRPSMVYGRGGGPPAALTVPARAGQTVRLIGTGENRWPLVHVDDLADLYLRALEKAPAGTAFVAAHGEAVRLRDIAEAAAALGGVAVETWELDEARAVLGPSADGLVFDQQVSSARAEKMLGWAPHAPTLMDEIAHGSY